MRISDWSSDVCSSDLSRHDVREHRAAVSDGQLYRGPSPDDCERLVRRSRRRGDTIPDGPVYQVTSMREIGRASCRERVCKYVEISVVDVTINKKNASNVI